MIWDDSFLVWLSWIDPVSTRMKSKEGCPGASGYGILRERSFCSLGFHSPFFAALIFQLVKKKCSVYAWIIYAWRRKSLVGKSVRIAGLAPGSHLHSRVKVRLSGVHHRPFPFAWLSFTWRDRGVKTCKPFLTAVGMVFFMWIFNKGSQPFDWFKLRRYSQRPRAGSNLQDLQPDTLCYLAKLATTYENQKQCKQRKSQMVFLTRTFLHNMWCRAERSIWPAAGYQRRGKRRLWS